MKYRMHRIAAATFILSYPPFKCRPQMYFSDEAIKCISPLHFQTVLVNVIFQYICQLHFSFHICDLNVLRPANLDCARDAMI